MYLLHGISRKLKMTLISRTVSIWSHDARLLCGVTVRDREQGSKGGSDRGVGSLSESEVVNASLLCPGNSFKKSSRKLMACGLTLSVEGRELLPKVGSSSC